MNSTQFDPPCSFKLIQEKYPINTFLFVRQHPESGIPYYQYMIQHLHSGVYLVSSLDRVIPIMRYFTTLQLAKEFIRTTEKIRLLNIPQLSIPTPSLADVEDSSSSDEDDGYDSSTDEESIKSVLNILNPPEKPKRKISEFQKAFRAYIKSNLQGKKFENREECNAFFRKIANEYKDINQKLNTHK